MAGDPADDVIPPLCTISTELVQYERARVTTVALTPAAGGVQGGSTECPKLRRVSRTALFEWIAVAVLLLGCAVFTAGVISVVLDGGLARVLMIVGPVIAVIGALGWTVVVKRAARARRTA